MTTNSTSSQLIKSYSLPARNLLHTRRLFDGALLGIRRIAWSDLDIDADDRLKAVGELVDILHGISEGIDFVPTDYEHLRYMAEVLAKAEEGDLVVRQSRLIANNLDSLTADQSK